MPKYRVYFTKVTEIGVTVEADDPEAAIEAAYDQAPSEVCAQCSGWNRPWFRQESDGLEPESVTDEDADGAEVWNSGQRWTRTRDDQLPQAVIDAVASAVSPAELGGPGSASSELIHRVAYVAYQAGATVELRHLADEIAAMQHQPGELFYGAIGRASALLRARADDLEG